MPESAVYVLEKMSHGYGRMGRAHGRGFYEYPEGGQVELWPGLRSFVRGTKPAADDEIRDRLLYVQALEALRCLQEGVIEAPRDADLGSVLGWGFPPAGGGVIGFVNLVGVEKFAGRARELAVKHGERFAPPAILEDHAARHEAF